MGGRASGGTGSGALLYLWGSRIVYSTIYAGEKIPFKHAHKRTHAGGALRELLLVSAGGDWEGGEIRDYY